MATCLFCNVKTKLIEYPDFLGVHVCAYALRERKLWPDAPQLWTHPYIDVWINPRVSEIVILERKR
jgi:hypothetical protein